MTKRTIEADGNDAFVTRAADKPVEYLIVLRAKLTADQAAEFEDCDELILRHPKKPSLIRARVQTAEVIR